MQIGETKIGVVKRYDSEKGYGFIKVDGETKDVFFHISQWKLGSANPPAVDSQVQFEVAEGKKGLQAANVRPASQADEASEGNITPVDFSAEEDDQEDMPKAA
ncbi:MAG: cold shock domain-containing protein [Candidatus Doudnabacteria bacterium]|nr:cold shock domain-containing protein [Candidatus Doudnabacteria bacterium]